MPTAGGKKKKGGILAGLHEKLDKLISQGEKAEAEKEPTPEEKDEERLREVDAKIEEVTSLLAGGHTRESVEREVGWHEARVASTRGESAPLVRVFHETDGGKRIPTTRRTQAKMQLATSLRLRLQVAEHAGDLEHALHVLVQEQVAILERQYGRRGAAD